MVFIAFMTKPLRSFIKIIFLIVMLNKEQRKEIIIELNY